MSNNTDFAGMDSSTFRSFDQGRKLDANCAMSNSMENSTAEIPEKINWILRISDVVALILRKTMPPELAHNVAMFLFRHSAWIVKKPSHIASLKIDLPKSKLSLHSPIGSAAGFDKDATSARWLYKMRFGFVECGTVTPDPQQGNPTPRMFRLNEDLGVINRMGFPSNGLERFVEQLKKVKCKYAPIGANVGANKNSVDRTADYITGIEAVWPHCQYITLNISSPNTPGLRGLQDKDALEDFLIRCGNTVKSAGSGKPVFLKVAPDLDQQAITDICNVVRMHPDWLSGLIISNTTVARPDTLNSAGQDEAGGLSGAPLMESATNVLKEFAKQLRGEFDLIGAGGISCGADAYAKIKAGASAVQLYSALGYKGIGLIHKMECEIADLLKQDGYTNISQAVGADL